jgi:hypothetical protein
LIALFLLKNIASFSFRFNIAHFLSFVAAMPGIIIVG